MIKRVYIDNFRSLVNFELNLGELTLLLGPNGVGKTSVLDVMSGLRQLLSGEAKIQAVFPTGTLTRWQMRKDQVYELDVVLDGDDLRYRLQIEHRIEAKRDYHPMRMEKSRIAMERLESGGRPLFEFKLGEVRLYTDEHDEGPTYTSDWTESALARVLPRPENSRLTRFLEFMRRLTICGLYPPSFATESRTEDPVLQRDGRNFASWYRNILLERQNLVPSFTETLKGVIDGFGGIRMEKVGLDTRAMKVEFDQYGEQYELNLDEVSDGQRALIALYAIVWLVAGQRDQRCALFLDEPDNYVALSEIQPWLMHLIEACEEGKMQAVLCSHHPELIDYLGSDKGLLLVRESTGVTKVRPARELVQDGTLRISEVIARGWEK